MRKVIILWKSQEGKQEQSARATEIGSSGRERARSPGFARPPNIVKIADVCAIRRRGETRWSHMLAL
ncbi:MAG: hypothetical protein HRF40_02830 [Nitrososphaera sp.]